MEITANAVQTVAANQNVLFTESPVPSTTPAIVHREGSGLVLLRGVTKQCRARYKVTFGGNIAVPTGGTPSEISMALSLNGEPIPATSMLVTPAAAQEYFNVSSSAFIDVPICSSYTLSVKNTDANEILVQGANLIVERVA